MLMSYNNLDLRLGFMTQAMWNGDYGNLAAGDYVFYRDLDGRDDSGKPNRELVPVHEAVGEIVSHLSDKEEQYDNLLHELRSAMDDLAEDDNYMSVHDFKRRIAPWLEGS